MNKKALIIVGVIAAVALIWYFMFYKKATPGPTTTAVTPALPGGSSGGSPVTIVPGTQTLDTTGGASGAQNTNLSIVQGWVNTLAAADKQHINAALPLMTADEIATLAGIVNTWTSGNPVSAAQTAFWNAWRVKYHVLDGSY
jgi:hypothetical protein